MIAYLKGELVVKSEEYIIIEVQSKPTKFLQICIFLTKKDKTEALDSDIIAVNEKETLGAKGKRYNTGNKADNSAG